MAAKEKSKYRSVITNWTGGNVGAKKVISYLQDVLEVNITGFILDECPNGNAPSFVLFHDTKIPKWKFKQAKGYADGISEYIEREDDAPDFVYY